MDVTEFTPELPELDVDPYAPGNRINRLPLAERIREAGPVVHIPKYNCYAVARYEDVNTVLRDYRRFTSTGGPGVADIRGAGSSRAEAFAITTADPPDHTVLRKVMNRIVSPAVVRTWREVFEREGAEIVDQAIAKCSFDVVRELSEKFVIQAFPMALGVKVERDQAVVTGHHSFNSLGPANDLFLETERAVQVHQEWMAKSRTREGLIPGGWGEQLFDAEDRGDLPPGIASNFMLALLSGGMDTTISVIGSAFALLGESRDQWDLLKKGPSLMHGLFNETLRCETPVQVLFRTTAGDIDFGGYRLKKSTKIQAFIAAGNRDPRKWNDPNRFDITRSAAQHLSLGSGVHYCIGQVIARLEFDAILKPFVKKVANFRMIEPAKWHDNNALRTLDRLMIEVELE